MQEAPRPHMIIVYFGPSTWQESFGARVKVAQSLSFWSAKNWQEAKSLHRSRFASSSRLAQGLPLSRNQVMCTKALFG